MKRITAAVLALVLMLSLAACGGSKKEEKIPSQRTGVAAEDETVMIDQSELDLLKGYAEKLEKDGDDETAAKVRSLIENAEEIDGGASEEDASLDAEESAD